MIRGVHTMFYSSKPVELRDFIQNTLGFSSQDIGDGWLIFDLPEADMGVHPAGAEHYNRSGAMDISFYCDDIHATVLELTTRGVVFTTEVEDHGYGYVTMFKAPGDFQIQLYQPKYSKD